MPIERCLLLETVSETEKKFRVAGAGVDLDETSDLADQEVVPGIPEDGIANFLVSRHGQDFFCGLRPRENVL